MFTKEDGRAEPGFIGQLLQYALALDLGQTVQVQQVERVEDHVPLAPDGERGLQLGEAVLHDDHLAVEDGLTDRDVESGGDGGGAFRPVPARCACRPSPCPC